MTLDDTGKILSVEQAGQEQPEVAGVEFYNGILVPGFINCHCHLELACLKGVIPKHTGLPGFIDTITSIPEVDKKNALTAAGKAEQEMLHNGIVACGDICNTDHTLSLKQKKKIFYHNFIEIMGVHPEDADMRYKEGWQLLKKFSSCDAGNSSMTLHAPYSSSSALTKKVRQRNEKRYSIHFRETASEELFFTKQDGDLYNLLEKKKLIPANPLKYPESILSDFADCAMLLLVHNTYLTEKELQKAEKLPDNYFYILCPKANLYIENKLPDINLLHKLQQPVALGTDSPASNDTLSILEEMKVIQQHCPDIPFQQVLLWGTLNGSKALGVDHIFGSFKAGKQPGINLITNFDYQNQQLTKLSKVKKLV